MTQQQPFGDYNARNQELSNIYKQQLSYLQNDKPLGGPANYSESTDYALQTLGQNRAIMDLFNAQQKSLATDRDRQITTMQRRLDSDLAAKRGSLGVQRQQKIDELAGQGVAPGSVFDRQIESIYTNQDAYDKQARQDLEDRISDINAGYTSQVNQLGAQHRNDLAQIQQKLSDRLADLQKSKSASAEKKADSILKVQQEYLASKNKLADDYYAMYKDAESRKQQELQNEIAVGNLTGSFRGNPTLGQQKELNDEAYRQHQLALAQQKLALSQQRASRVGSSSAVNTSNVNQIYEDTKNALARNGGQIGDYLSAFTDKALSSKDKIAFYGKALKDVASGNLKFTPSQKITQQTGKDDALKTMIANSLANRLQSLKK